MLTTRCLVVFGFAIAIVAAAACSGDGDTTPPIEGGATDARKDGTALEGAIADDTGTPWPDCLTMPATAKVRSLPEIWNDNPAKQTETWVSGVYVTAVSKGACTANEACSFFVQQDLTYASVQAAAHHGLKVFVSAATASHFVGVKVGDKVDLLGWAWRYNIDGQNELLLQINLALPGCFKNVGSGTATPVVAYLSDFTVGAYEQTLGPVLVDVEGVTGTPQQPGETFGLGKTGQFTEGGIQDVTSLSPFYLPGGVFVGLPTGMKTNFTRVIGVFGLFVPPTDGGAATKYKEIYPRTMADVVQ